MDGRTLGRHVTKQDDQKEKAPMGAIGIGEAVGLGVAEGISEFLPVSSTGLLKIAEGLMGVDVQNRAVVGFTAVIQVGAIAAVLLYFRGDIRRLGSAWLRGVSRTGPRDSRDASFTDTMLWAARRSWQCCSLAFPGRGRRFPWRCCGI
ncbi:undecaprenyl-diphosphate phosphatase [Actinomadura geliboluensis]|uniref:undecaprenyl-diphosphate phosphatase n=1 Tax=Actinomadura geliboluensis TaxID=882440 RepID=UPI0036944D66